MHVAELNLNNSEVEVGVKFDWAVYILDRAVLNLFWKRVILNIGYCDIETYKTYNHLGYVVVKFKFQQTFIFFALNLIYNKLIRRRCYVSREL